MTGNGRECVWCGSPANSKEHAFPQWLRKFDGPSKYIADYGRFQEPAPRLVVRRDPEDGWVEYEETRGAKTPVLHEVQVKAVCGSCNSGWMSQMEVAAKPIVERLINGSGDVPEEDLRTLAGWAHKTFLMYDLWEPKLDRRYGSRDYQEFYVDRCPSLEVRLYLAFSPAATFGMWSDSRLVIPPRVDQLAYMDAHWPNCGSSFLAVDGLFVVEHWFSSDYPSEDRLRKFGRSVRRSSHRKMQKLGTHEIWPNPQGVHDWPRPELNPKELNAARLGLFDALRRRRVFAKRTPPPT